MREKKAFKKHAKELNENKQGDQAAFYLKKNRTKLVFLFFNLKCSGVGLKLTSNQSYKY